VTLLIQYNADVTIINGEGRKPSQVTNSTEVKQLIKGKLIVLLHSLDL